MSEVIKAHDKSTEERNGAKGNGAARAVLVSANALAAHLCCVRSYIGCGADAVANEAVL